jgi:hypothetical protein
VLEEDVDEDESLSESDDDDEEDVEELDEEGVAVLFGNCCIISSMAKVRHERGGHKKRTMLSFSLLSDQRTGLILDPK